MSKSHIAFFIRTFILCVLCFCNSIRGHAQEKNYKAYSVYVYNFIKYIEWPEESKKGDFVIAIIGNSPISAELKTLAATKKAGGQTIVIKQFATVAEVDNCQILYISAGKSGVLKEAIEKTKNMSALMIAEREGLAKKGAGINFVTLEDETLKFEVNKKVIEAHNLKIPKVLFSLGLVVG
ncbi:MAG TPA: YfiR family protein [Bacteroidia bacterium]|nr:YfiR family protein [Bacteroidia bacterium]